MKVINEEQENWEDNIESVLFCYRASKNDSTKFSPFFLMYGREPRLPIEMKIEGSAPVPPATTMVLQKFRLMKRSDSY